MKYEIKKITQQFMIEGLFSEYLPPKFNLQTTEFDLFKDIPIANKCDYVEPYKYTMSRFSENDKRRVIHLPELTAYISVVNYMRDHNIIKDLIDISIKDGNSFSKLIQANGDISKREITYDISSNIKDTDNDFAKSSYIPNVVQKINRAKGAKGVMCLDISNFYGSIYTHIIPSIALGYEEAIRQYKIFLGNNQDPQVTGKYKIYKELDEKVRTQNAGRTNGLLTGPLISHFLAETLLSRIDEEITSNGINFIRYADDYEVFIYDEANVEKTMSLLDGIMSKYFFVFNNEKTKYISFPYYVIENLEKIYKGYLSTDVDSAELIDLFNRYFSLEKDGTKGAIRYLIKSIDSRIKIKNNNLYASFLLDVLVNDNRSLIKVCELMIKEKHRLIFEEDSIKIIKSLIVQCIREQKDLEVIWLLYLLKSINVDNLDDSEIENIIVSGNELAIVILLCEYEHQMNDKFKKLCVDSAKSWILLYQLYLNKYITKQVFEKKSGIKNNVAFYAHLKRRKFTLYKQIIVDEETIDDSNENMLEDGDFDFDEDMFRDR